MLLFIRLNATIAATFPVKRRYRHNFLGQMLLTPPIFRLKAVKAAIYPVRRCERPYFSC